jgi:hypothetical protein
VPDLAEANAYRQAVRMWGRRISNRIPHAKEIEQLKDLILSGNPSGSYA